MENNPTGNKFENESKPNIEENNLLVDLANRDRLDIVEEYKLDKEEATIKLANEVLMSKDDFKEIVAGVKELASSNDVQGLLAKLQGIGVGQLTVGQSDAINDAMNERFEVIESRIDDKATSREYIKKYTEEKVADIKQIKGLRGKDGNDGKDGKDAVDMEWKDIKTKYLKSSKNDRLNLKQIRGGKSVVELLNKLITKIDKQNSMINNLPKGGTNLVGGAGNGKGNSTEDLHDDFNHILTESGFHLTTEDGKRLKY